MLQGEEKEKIKLPVTFSPQHVEIDLTKTEGYEKHVITALVEETHTLARKGNHTDSCGIWHSFDLIYQTRLPYLSYRVISCGYFCSNCSIPSRSTLCGYPSLHPLDHGEAQELS